MQPVHKKFIDLGYKKLAVPAHKSDTLATSVRSHELNTQGSIDHVNETTRSASTTTGVVDNSLRNDYLVTTTTTCEIIEQLKMLKISRL